MVPFVSEVVGARIAVVGLTDVDEPMYFYLTSFSGMTACPLFLGTMAVNLCDGGMVSTFGPPFGGLGKEGTKDGGSAATSLKCPVWDNIAG